MNTKLDTFRLSYSNLTTWINAEADNNATTEKVKSFNIHDFIHGLDEHSKAISQAPIGTIKVISYYSRRALLKRVPGGSITCVGQLEESNSDGSEKIRFDAVAISGNDWIVSWTPHCRYSCDSSIKREGRDAIPVSTPSNDVYIRDWVMDTLNERRPIGDFTNIGDVQGINSFRRWFKEHMPSNQPFIKFPESYREYVKERASNVHLNSTARALLTFGTYGTKGYDLLRYDKERKVFTTSRNCSVTMDIEEARKLVGERKTFNTQYGTFRYSGNTAICGCHTFALSHVEEVLGLATSNEKEIDAISQASINWKEGKKNLDAWMREHGKAYREPCGNALDAAIKRANYRAMQCEYETRKRGLFKSIWFPLYTQNFGKKIARIALDEIERVNLSETSKAVLRKLKVSLLLEGKSGAWQGEYERGKENIAKTNRERANISLKRSVYISIENTLKALAIGDHNGVALTTIK